MRKTLFAGAIVLIAVLVPKVAQAALADREPEPIVITGADTPKLLGVEPDRVVAFRYSNGWQQVPVQVDERKMLDYRPIRQRGANTNGFTGIGYADPNTWAEADGVPQTETASPRGTGAPIPGTTGDSLLDPDDEIAMMLIDGGGPAGGHGVPAGVDAATLTEVKVADPLDPGSFRYLYLFLTTTGLDPSAGIDRVSYDNVYNPPLANGYRLGYNFGKLGDNINGPPINPEASVVETDRYRIGIPARWMIDELRLKADAATGVDILDGDKSTVGTTSCGRNELTFSRGEGGMIANIDGPVRAIRSFIGANSGTYTQRDYVFYEGLFENRTYLRVHPGINQFVMAMDLSPEAIGMTYRNSLNPDGFPIDGVQDSPVPGKYDWDQFSGAQGTVTNVPRYDIDIEDTEYSSYYQDVENPSDSSMLCSGDDHSYGAAGALITTPLNNTDPARMDEWPNLPLSHFSGVRYSWFDGPQAGVTLAQERAFQVDNPVRVETKGIADTPAAAKLTIKVKPPKLRLRPGRKGTFHINLVNTGTLAAEQVKLCFQVKHGLRKPPCRKPGRIGVGGKRSIKVKIRLKKNVSRGSTHLLRIKLTSKNAGRKSALVRVKSRR